MKKTQLKKQLLQKIGFTLVVRPPTPMLDELNEEADELQWLSSESDALSEEESCL